MKGHFSSSGGGGGISAYQYLSYYFYCRIVVMPRVPALVSSLELILALISQASGFT